MRVAAFKDNDKALLTQVAADVGHCLAINKMIGYERGVVDMSMMNWAHGPVK